MNLWQSVESAGPAARPSVLREAQIGRVHDEALSILAQVGIVMHSALARQLLRQHGAEVDEVSGLARIPRNLIELALERAPRQFTLYSGAEAVGDCRLGPEGGQYGRPISGLNWIVDATAKRRREVTQADAVNWTRVAQGLANIHVVSAAYDQEGHPNSMEVRAVARMLQNTAKPLMMSAVSGEGMRWVKRLTEVTQSAGRQPRVMVLSSVNSPLAYGSGQAEAALAAAELGIPVAFNSSVVAGVTAPVTVAGALAQMHAEMLAALVIIQLQSPGAPVIYTGHPLVMDMKTGLASVGFAEIALLQAACVDIGRYFGLPTGSNGLVTDACTPDPMAASEKWSAAYLAALAGANINGAAGSLACLSTISLEQLVIDDDIYGRMFRQLRGFALDADTLASEVIARAAPSGAFLMDDHTLEHFRDEYWYSGLANRLGAPSWEAAGSRDVLARAVNKVADLLQAWQPVVSPEQERELANLARAGELALANMELPA
ncbi:MAG: trimethylamine methyltransferase family protein [Chloroflexota bacterium]